MDNMQLAILRQGVDIWNEWRKNNHNAFIALSAANLEGASLYGADLSRADLSEANFRAANLEGASLYGAHLSRADLSRADLSRADLSGAYLSGANLSGANLSGANLSGANLSGAYLSGANLYGANLSGANLRWANLSGAMLIPDNEVDEGMHDLPDEREVNLSEVDLSRADLSRADLSEAKLSGAKLFGADLSGADLSGTDLSEADLSEADLSEAYLYGANLSGAKLSKANLSDANLSGANLKGADLEGATPPVTEQVLNIGQIGEITVIGEATVRDVSIGRDGTDRVVLTGDKNVIYLKSKLALSFSNAKRIAKGYSSPFIVILYLSDSRSDVDQVLRSTFGTRAYSEQETQTNLSPGMQVTIELFSPSFEFSPSSRKVKLGEQPTKVDFGGQPSSTCMPGEHTIQISILDAESNFQYVSQTVYVQVVDFAFDHVSRPKLQIGVSTISAIGAVAVWVLTFLGQIDTTWGFASGTAAAAVSGALLMHLQQIYRSPNTTTNFPAP